MATVIADMCYQSQLGCDDGPRLFLRFHNNPQEVSFSQGFDHLKCRQLSSQVCGSFQMSEKGSVSCAFTFSVGLLRCRSTLKSVCVFDHFVDLCQPSIVVKLLR